MKQEVILTNVTALVDTGVEFDLFMISQKVANCSFNTRRLPAVILRKIQPKCTLLIFKSGKIMSLGAQSEKDAQISMKKVCKQLEKVCSIRIKKFDFRVTNIFGTAQVDFQIHLPKLCDIGGAIKLDNFPGAFYRMKQHIKAATIYSSGKITLIGGRSREDLEKAMIYLQKTLRNFTKQKPVQSKVPQIEIQTVNAKGNIFRTNLLPKNQNGLKAHSNSLPVIKENDETEYEPQII